MTTALAFPNAAAPSAREFISGPSARAALPAQRARGHSSTMLRSVKCIFALGLLALLLPAFAGATETCSAGGTGTIVQCNDESSLVDIRTLLGWLVGVALFAMIVPIFSRTFRT